MGKDVAGVLGYANTRDALSKHVDLEDKSDVAIHDGSQNRTMTIINESGLYSLILGSKLPSAKKFKKWVTSDVLPSIRKHGMYATDELINNPDLLIAAATKIKEERQARLEAEKLRDKLIHQNKLYTTSEIAKELGYKDTTNAIKQHCRWVVKHKVPHPQSKNKTLEVNVIPEGDMYRLITNSELPSAEKFESWVFDEVLPSIRKHVEDDEKYLSKVGEIPTLKTSNHVAEEDNLNNVPLSNLR
ncbi:Bro-N domain-containing protein [Clostridium paraputrificum]|uniref:BRO-N domain-containing protein n=1 Tax=Clostridium paraputrificum TaxID=29363 RepID=UPI003A5CC922